MRLASILIVAMALGGCYYTSHIEDTTGQNRPESAHFADMEFCSHSVGYIKHQTQQEERDVTQRMKDCMTAHGWSVVEDKEPHMWPMLPTKKDKNSN